jgi:hypothetical protein
VTWLLWGIAPLVAFAAQLSQGVGIKALTTFIVGFMPATIFIGSFVNKDAEWRLSRFDLVCGTLSIMGLLLWAVTSDGNVAILFAILADALAAVPTLIKAYAHPETESDTLFWFGVVNAGIGLLIIDSWRFENYAFAAYLLGINFALAAIIRFRPARLFVTMSD